MSAYHIVPRDDPDQETSPLDCLLPTSPVGRKNIPSPAWTLNINAVILLRILSTTLAIISFVFSVLAGGDAFIASDIFMMPLIILNVLQVINHIFTVILKVTIDFRSQSRQVTLGHTGKDKPRISMYFDIGLALILLITIPIAHASKSREYYRRGNVSLWMSGAIIGYFVIGIQLLLALPQLTNKKLTLTVKLSPLNEEKKYRSEPDVKVNFPAMQKSREEEQEAELPRPSTDTLV